MSGFYKKNKKVKLKEKREKGRMIVNMRKSAEIKQRKGLYITEPLTLKVYI